MAYQHWTIEGLPWDQLDPSKVDPDLLKVVKAAALVEYNAGAYADYLCKVFGDDPEFDQAARDWAVEEIQHGKALGLWAERIDPGFSLEAAMARFREGYHLPLLNADRSVRGSKSGELVARCMVETGTSSYYSAIGSSTQEVVLKTICGHIAADEFRHYKLFYDHLKRYLKKENLGRFARIRVALGRIVETEDDELAYAFYAANAPDEPYDREKFSRAYVRRAYSYYKFEHVDRGVAMLFKACGLKPHSMMFNVASQLAWWLMSNRAKQLAKLAA